MNRVDFSDYKFRCHALGKLMTNSRVKSEPLSKTTQSYLNQLHTEEMFNRRYEIKSKYLDKGIQCEEQAITLYSNVTGELFLKNKKRYENDFLSGEPDNIDGKVRDIKNSWSFETFPMYEEEIPTKDYIYQLQGYMALTGLKQAELIYCLVDTPDLLIEDEKRRTCWKLGFMDLPDELATEIEINMKYADIPDWMRVKVFGLEYDDSLVNQMYERIELCRGYLNELSEKLVERMPVEI